MPQANQIATLENRQVIINPSPVRVHWTFADLLARDGFDLRCDFTCSIRAIPDATEKRMLEEVLLHGRASVSDTELAEHFKAALRTEAATMADTRDAGEWLGEEQKQRLIEALRRAATPVAFSCGVELLPPFELQLESRGFQQQRLRAMQQAMAEQRVAGQVEHFQRASELLKRFQTLRQAAPDLSAGDVLEQISPADRGSVLQTVLLASAKQEDAKDLWAVAGPYLVKVDGRSTPPKTELTPLPPTLGPLRSVQAAMVQDERVLLVGARSGFFLVRPDRPSEAQAYPDPGIESSLGFSRVIYWSQRDAFCACHGDAGIVCWSRMNTEGPISAIRLDRLQVPRPSAASANVGSGSLSNRVAGPRNLQPLGDGWLIFSVGNRLLLLDELEDVAELKSDTDSEVAAIVPDDRRILVVHEDGTVCAKDRVTHETLCEERRSGRVTAAGALPWLGGVRLLLASEDGPVQCVGVDDGLVTQYASAHRGLRVVSGSADLVAAVSADRQRVILWHTWEGRQPLAEVYLGGLAKHRVADVDFG